MSAATAALFILDRERKTAFDAMLARHQAERAAHAAHWQPLTAAAVEAVAEEREPSHHELRLLRRLEDHCVVAHGRNLRIGADPVPVAVATIDACRSAGWIVWDVALPTITERGFRVLARISARA